MPRSRQAAYLDALGIDVYVRRERAGQGARQAGTDVVAGRAGDAAVTVGAPDSLQGQAACHVLDALRTTVAACTRCELHATRTQTVFGVGNPSARWMFIGEAPGADEDRQGEPFVGRAGQLLTSMIRALGLRREDVYIANVLKCRPPGNRDPRPDEARACRDYLERQIELVDPSLIIAVGRIAAQNLLETDTALARMRGRVHALGPGRRPLIVIYHPAYLLRSPGEKRKAWVDLLFARGVFRRLERGEQVLP